MTGRDPPTLQPCVGVRCEKEKGIAYYKLTGVRCEKEKGIAYYKLTGDLQSHYTHINA